MIERRVLITNLWCVTIDNVLRTHCNALLLESEEDPNNSGSYRCEIRGFGTEAAWPVFSLSVPTIDHELLDDRILLLKTSSSAPRDTPKIDLIRADVERPIAIQMFEWDSKDNPRGHRFGAIWAALEESVVKHWDAPYMPRLVHMEPAQALKLPSRAAALGTP